MPSSNVASKNRCSIEASENICVVLRFPKKATNNNAKQHTENK